MTRTTHTAIGLALGFAIGHALNQPPVFQGISAVACAFSAVLADFDIRLRLKHRGITHSLLALAVVAVLSVLVYQPLAFAVIGGYASHLCADMLTPRGVPLLYPWNKRFRVAKWSTGGGADWMIWLLSAILTIWFMSQLRGV